MDWILSLAYLQVVLIGVENNARVLVEMSHQLDCEAADGVLEIGLLGINEHSHLLLGSVLDDFIDSGDHVADLFDLFRSVLELFLQEANLEDRFHNESDQTPRNELTFELA